MMTETIKVGGAYFREHVNAHHIGEATVSLFRWDNIHPFDTIAVTGLSGVLFGQRLAIAMNKHLAVVRKHDDKSTHDCSRVVGEIGSRFIIVDDLISSGQTVGNILAEVSDLVRYHSPGNVQYVGSYMYRDSIFTPASEGVSGYEPVVIPDNLLPQTAAVAPEPERAGSPLSRMVWGDDLVPSTINYSAPADFGFGKVFV